MANVSFLGLGTMGYPMAGHLVTKGHSVTVFNRTTAKAEAWCKEFGGKTAPTPIDAAKGADIVFACVGNDDDLREVCIGETGAFHSMPKDAVFVDHTTVSASVTEELHRRASEMDLHFIDAPISGGQAGAENGALSIMCGGAANTYARVEPVLSLIHI